MDPQKPKPSERSSKKIISLAPTKSTGANTTAPAAAAAQNPTTGSMARQHQQKTEGKTGEVRYGGTTKSQITSPSAAGEWTVVTRRRRDAASAGRKPRPAIAVLHPVSPQIEILNSPSPWSPVDSLVDPERQSKLLRRMQSAIQRLEQSRFYQKFLLRLRSPSVQDGLAGALASASTFNMVVYGVGSIESYEPPRLQLALAVLLHRELGPSVATLEIFDPVLSATECAVASSLGCTVISVDERGRREVTAPTLFYMPHCEVALYDGLLQMNWYPLGLRRMVVLGNSFSAYGKYVDEGGWCRGTVAVEAAARHVLRARRFVNEVEMEDTGEIGREEGEGQDGIFKAFHDTNWHFFVPEDNQQIDI